MNMLEHKIEEIYYKINENDANLLLLDEQVNVLENNLDCCEEKKKLMVYIEKFIWIFCVIMFTFSDIFLFRIDFNWIIVIWYNNFF